MSSTAPFELSREQPADGAYRRQESAFRGRVTADGSSGFRAEPGRYHLYVARACPWAHRAVIVRRLKGLEEVISASWLDPIRDARGWAFTGGPFTDPINGFEFLSEAYQRTQPSFDGRVSVPVLWDRESDQIVSNESAEIVRMLNSEWDEWANDLDLYPEHAREEIDRLNERIYATVNNGVYRSGFATTQAAYEEAYEQLFDTLDWLEERLRTRRYLVGDRPTEADWRVFPTLVRFDAVYHNHFKCNRQKLIQFPNLWAYTRDLFSHDGIAETVDMDQVKRHYYCTHPMINPTGIVPVGPRTDFGEPHGREHVGAALSG